MAAYDDEDDDKYESNTDENDEDSDYKHEFIEQQIKDKSIPKHSIHSSKLCCCINIYNGLYIINAWNIFISIPCILIGFARLNINVVFPVEIETFFYTVWFFICYLAIMCLRVIAAFIGFSLIPLLKNEKIQYSNIHSSKYHEKNVLRKYEVKTRLYCWLLLWAPILQFFVLLMEICHHTNDWDNMVIMVFVAIYFAELFMSLYFYYIASRFIDDKWKMELWGCMCRKSCFHSE
eukprot:356111_1